MASAGTDKMADEDKDRQDEEEIDEQVEARPAPALAAPAATGGMFHIYKSGQGYWTRMGTVIALGLIVLLSANFTYERLKLLITTADNRPRTGWILGILGFGIAAITAVAFRVLNKPKVADFLIATESEMKKVNWTSRKELMGSTKVVIGFMFLLTTILFFIDIAFGYFFMFVRVLKFGPFHLGN